jgi:hypothetical protein
MATRTQRNALGSIHPLHGSRSHRRRGIDTLTIKGVDQSTVKRFPEYENTISVYGKFRSKSGHNLGLRKQNCE